MTDSWSALLVPPLSAYGGVPSMTLYWRNLREAFAEMGLSSPHWRVIEPRAWWRAAGVKRRLCQRIILPGLIRRATAEERTVGRRPVLHVLDPHYSHLLSNHQPGVVTCHDLDALISPALGWAKGEERARLRQLVRAGAIHAISRNTAQDVTRFFPGCEAKVIVNYYGLDPVFRPRKPTPDAPHLAKLRAEPNAFFVLHVGSNIERKNIPVLLRGFAEAKALQHHVHFKLVKVGHDLAADGYDGMLRELGLIDDIIHIGSLGATELVDVYNYCHAFCFPSRYEGFGRPVAEAQACGLPCVLADTSSLPEIGSSAALYHAADDSFTLARHLLALADSKEAREQLRLAGLANVRRFSWRRHAELIVESYARLSL